MRYIKSAGIVAISALSGFLVLAFSWLPNGGVYSWVSGKFWGPALLWLAGAKLKVEGLENLQKGQACVFYSNHQSHFDIPAITTAVPISMYFIAKRELLKIPFFGWGMWAIGMVFVDRSNPERARASMEKAARAVQKGKHIITFPEGTRSKDGALQVFKKGTFHLAKSGPIALVPIAVIGSRHLLNPGENVLPSGVKLRSVPVTVRIGTPITEREVAEMSLPELTKHAREKVLKLMED